MLKLPTDKSILVDGKTVNYTVPSSGRYEVEQTAKTNKNALVYSEFIADSAIAHEIARKEKRRVETCTDGGSSIAWAYKVV